MQFQSPMNLRGLLETMLRNDASDLHLKVGSPPVVRLHGRLAPIEGESPVSRDEMDGTLRDLLTDAQYEEFLANRELDCAIGVSQLGRFRMNLAFQRGTPTVSLRAIPVSIKSLESLNLPPVIGELASKSRGLVLVTGITGSGKTTTLAAMIEHINQRKQVKVVTIEDPIEYLFRDNKSFISQREVGTDTNDFTTALRHVLRQDPEVIMIGEIRDTETMDIALKAANSGHLVFATLHTTNAVQTIQRILTFFPAHQHSEVRSMLAENLHGVVSLRLIERANGAGRLPACEVMVSTEAIRDYLQSPDTLEEIAELIAEGGTQYGMQSFDQSLMRLLGEGHITEEEAMAHASNPSEFALRLRGIEGTSERTWGAV